MFHTAGNNHGSIGGLRSDNAFAGCDAGCLSHWCIDKLEPCLLSIQQPNRAVTRMSCPDMIRDIRTSLNPLLFCLPSSRKLRISAGEMLIAAVNFLQKQQKQRDLLRRAARRLMLPRGRLQEAEDMLDLRWQCRGAIERWRGPASPCRCRGRAAAARPCRSA